jgi:hypothetical protein
MFIRNVEHQRLDSDRGEGSDGYASPVLLSRCARLQQIAGCK